jgi:hypothetical protein
MNRFGWKIAELPPLDFSKVQKINNVLLDFLVIRYIRLDLLVKPMRIQLFIYG